MTKRGLATLLLLVGVLVVSSTTLETFPAPYDDEGQYAAFGKGFVDTGQYASESLLHNPPFEKGSGLNTRLGPILFGLASKVTGENLVTARAVSFFFTVVATVFWVLIARALGFPAVLGALLFATTERVVYSSHAFRPEAALVLFNSVFIWMLLTRKDSMKSGIASTRGILNAGFVLAHGNGLVSALLNSIDFTVAFFRKRNLLAPLLYVSGSFFAIFLFYLVQIRDIGGWQVWFAQLRAPIGGASHAFGGILETISREAQWRWGMELYYVGGSIVAKLMRVAFYATMLGTAIYSVFRQSGDARRLGFLTIGCFLGYVFVVNDKIDIHIAEMIPYFMASFLAWAAASRRAGGRKALIANGALASVLLINLSLFTHHQAVYREPGSIATIQGAVDRYLAASHAKGEAKVQTMIGDMKHWFHFHGEVHYIGDRYRAEFLPLKGTVLTLTKLADSELPNCVPRALSADEAELFKVYDCR